MNEWMNEWMNECFDQWIILFMLSLLVWCHYFVACFATLHPTLSLRPCFCSLWSHCSCPNDQLTSITAPAHPHATWVAVYPALFCSLLVICFGTIDQRVILVKLGYNLCDTATNVKYEMEQHHDIDIRSFETGWPIWQYANFHTWCFMPK